jgi:hypothetical protein
MSWQIAQTALDQAVSHAPVVALLTVYFVGFALMGLRIMVGLLLLLHDLGEGIRRLRRRS